MVRIYEDHNDKASRFVGMTDKTAPVAVDILGPGSMFMQEDYDTNTLDDLQRIHAQLRQRYDQRYPEPELRLLHIAQEKLMVQFEHVFEPATFHTRSFILVFRVALALVSIEVAFAETERFWGDFE